MTKYYFTKEEIKEQIELLDKYSPNSEEYKNQGLKIIASYCKPLILTNKGIKHGLELIRKYKNGDELSRTELFDCYILGTEANLVTEGKGTYELLSEVWKKIYEKYKPETEYLQSYIYEVIYPAGYVKSNPNFTKDSNNSIKNYTEERPGLKAIFFTIDIHIMKDDDNSW